MTRIICAALLVTVAVLCCWTALLDLRNARLSSALAIERAHPHAAIADDLACSLIRAEARRGDFVATLQAAVRLYQEYPARPWTPPGDE
ncbi:MAG: hypothetical protein JWM53_4367 [bacterium]|nr:hypothetical protein [bacterium]